MDNLVEYHISTLEKCNFFSHELYYGWLGGLLVERRTSVSLMRDSIPGQVAAV